MKLDMKKMIALFSLSAVFITTNNSDVMAYNVPDIVNVGLETVAKNVSSITIGNNNIYIGYINDNDEFVENGSLTSSAGFTVTSGATNYVSIEDRFTKEEAEIVAINLTNEGVTAYVTFLGESGYTIFISGKTSDEVMEITDYEAFNVPVSNAFKIENGNYTYLFPTEFGGVLKGDGADDTFTIKEKVYRGYLSFDTNGTTLTPVNVIGIEEYLYGVVPREMPHLYHEEALKSQAVSARTYALSKSILHTGTDYLICDKIHCQVYDGYSFEKESTNSAIDNTAGQIITYNGEPIEAFFYAASGGYTENSEDVWYDDLPYIKAVPEIGVEADATWKVELTANQVGSLAGVGTATDVVITKLSTGGRVQEVKVVGTTGTKVETGDSIRSLFGGLNSKMFTINGNGGDIEGYLVDDSNSFGDTNDFMKAVNKGITIKTEGDLQHLNGKTVQVPVSSTREVAVKVSDVADTNLLQKGNDYEISSVYISTKNDTGKYVFNGAGNGHGIGLSQKGADAMAKLGYDYRQILNYYYDGIEIE